MLFVDLHLPQSDAIHAIAAPPVNLVSKKQAEASNRLCRYSRISATAAKPLQRVAVSTSYS